MLSSGSIWTLRWTWWKPWRWNLLAPVALLVYGPKIPLDNHPAPNPGARLPQGHAEEGLVRVPASFPSQPIQHTPRSTNLHDPEAQLPGPRDNGLMLLKELSAQLQRSQQLTARCETVMFEQEKKVEEMHRTYRDTTPPRNISRRIDQEQNNVEREGRYHALHGRQDRLSSCGIPPSPSHLLVEGHVPIVVVVDTGACSILVGRKFAASIAKLEPRHLKRAPSVITTCGQPSRPIGLSVSPLEFVLADGTENRTKFLAPVIVMDIDTYDILLGKEFIASCGGGMDSQCGESFWRLDYQYSTGVPHMRAHLPLDYHMRYDVLKEVRHAHYSGEVWLAADLMDAQLGDESAKEELGEP